MHLSIHSSSFPTPSLSLTHAPIHSLAVSLDAFGSVSPGERDVIHYLTFQLSLFPNGSGPGPPPPPPRGSSVSGNISVPQSAEWHSWSQWVRGTRSFHCPAVFHCNAFHGWFILINTAVCFIRFPSPLKLQFHFYTTLSPCSACSFLWLVTLCISGIFTLLREPFVSWLFLILLFITRA